MSLSSYANNSRNYSTIHNANNVVLTANAQDSDHEVYESPDESTSLLTGISKNKVTLGVRHLVSFLGFLGFANVYAMRVNLSVAIVVMVNNTAIHHVNTSSPDVCPLPDNSTSDNNTDGPFNWDEKEQGLILGSFFWGYILTNLIGGRLAEIIGGRIVMGVGVFGTAFLTVLTPLFANWSSYAFIALRVLEGMFEGVTYPAMSSLLSRWIPPSERSTTIAFVYAGSLFGTVISLPISGLLCDSDIFGGWPSVFYLFGAIAMMWSSVWFLLASDSPECHKFISNREVMHITTALRGSESTQIRKSYARRFADGFKGVEHSTNLFKKAVS